MADIENVLEDAWRALAESDSTPSSPLAMPPDRRMPLSRIALFAQLEEVREDWAALRSTIEAGPPGDAERYVNGGWTLEDLVAHAASWAKEFRHEVETVFRGGSFDYAIPYVMTLVGPTEWNEEQVRARSAQSLDESFDEIERETVRLQDLLSEMSEAELYRFGTFPLAPSGDPEALWSGPSAVIIAGKCQHDRHHLSQLKACLARWR